MKKYLFAGLFAIALLMFSVDWHSFGGSLNHDAAFNQKKLMVASANELKRTIVIPTPATAFDPRKNVLWCATFQLAWNETRALVGEDLHFNPESPLTSELNASAVTTNDLDSPSYVALAGFVKDQIHQRIHESLDRKFGGAASPHFIPIKDSIAGPQDIVAYAYLFKNLEFPVPFEALEQPLILGNVELPSFGMGAHKSGHEQMASQINILDYQGPDDFVIELKTKLPSDHLLLAKIQPKPTLTETIDSVESRIRLTQPHACLPADELAIPKFNFDITRQFKGLEGAKLMVSNRNIAGTLFLLSAMQDIRFQMDEKGVRLKSESHISFGCAQAPLPAHVMIFDKPFLIILRRTEGKNPYFVMWVANSELFLRP